MRLLSCYIENFGNIKQREYDFGAGITACCENNGYGKTTLASFLKAMFYGMKPTTARDKEVGERKRFYPFEGGKFGGNVTFEHGGDVYKIVRFFGEKSATDDTKSIYRNDVLLPDSEAEAGREFLGIDEQSFLKTVFINSDDTEVSATGDIGRMLNEFVDDTDFEGAVASLEKQKKEYKASRGNNDKISRQKSYIADLKDSVGNKRKISEGLGAKYAKLNALKEEVEALRRKQNAEVEINLQRQKWNTYDNYRNDADEAHKKLSLMRAKYPSGLPDGAEAQELLNCADGISRARERLSASQMTDGKKSRLCELENYFSAGFPDSRKMTEMNALTADKIRLDAEICGIEQALGHGDDARFSSGIPDEEELSKYVGKLSALRELKENKNAPAEPESHKKLLLIPAILSVVLICVGIGMFFVKTLVGGILSALGAVVALVGVFFYFKGQINLVKTVNGNSQNGKISELENEIRSFLSRLGYFTQGGVEVDFNNLLRDIEIYRRNAALREENTAQLKRKKEERAAVALRIKEFLSAYGLKGENESAELAGLDRSIAEYTALKGEKESAETRTADCNREIKNYTAKAIDILSKYDVAPEENLVEQSRRIDADGRELSRLTESYKELDRRAVGYRAENNLTNRPQKEETAEDVKQILDKKVEELARTGRDIDEDESATETLNSLTEELAAAEDTLKELQSEYELIKKTVFYLEKAENELKDKYVRPIRESFLKYSAMLEKALGEKVIMDKDFKIFFERSGERRSDAHLSAGQKSLCTLCLRLALIDNMYKGDSPFIILDDPFVHLDAEHMMRARTLLSELSKDRQIVYFCCHPSRALNVT